MLKIWPLTLASLLNLQGVQPLRRKWRSRDFGERAGGGGWGGSGDEDSAVLRYYCVLREPRGCGLCDAADPGDGPAWRLHTLAWAAARAGAICHEDVMNRHADTNKINVVPC